jgi:hypothetical protein
MQQEALKLRHAINKIERLLDHSLAYTDKFLLDHVQSRIDAKAQELGLNAVPIDHGLVDWGALIQAAIYRQAPFQAGDKEKGFRDALVAESFLQLVAGSPKNPQVCRVVLVTEDKLLAEAVKQRISSSPNARILESIEDLKGLINAIVSNAGEDFIAQLKPKASRIFFVSSEVKDTLYFKESIGDKLRDKFKAELAVIPEGADFRKDERWIINHPNFSRKEGHRIHWTTRIDIETEAGVYSKGAGNKSLHAGAAGAYVPVGKRGVGVAARAYDPRDPRPIHRLHSQKGDHAPRHRPLRGPLEHRSHAGKGAQKEPNREHPPRRAHLATHYAAEQWLIDFTSPLAAPGAARI